MKENKNLNLNSINYFYDYVWFPKSLKKNMMKKK